MKMKALCLGLLFGVRIFYINVCICVLCIITFFIVSPEVIELKGASSKSDIWSLGCTIIELYTGKPPYSDLIAMTAMFKIVEDECPPIPDGVSAVINNNHIIHSFFLKQLTLGAA